MNTYKTKNFTIFYWIFLIFLFELSLHFIAYGNITLNSLYIFPFSIVFSLILDFLTGLFDKRINTIFAIIFVFGLTILYGSQLVFYKVFGGFYPASALTLGGNVLLYFYDQILITMKNNWYFILLFLVPIVIFFILLKKSRRFLEKHCFQYTLAILVAATFIFSMTIDSLDKNGTGFFTIYDYYYGVDTQTELSVNCFGNATTFRLELQNFFFPKDVEEEDFEVEEEPEPTIERNLLDLYIPYDQDSNESSDIQYLNDYISSYVGTTKNEYTGLFAGKNLIVICAESYSPVLLDEERFPALYKLANNGIVFNNYYTSYQNTTTNCEYSLCTGLLPDLSRSKWDSSFLVSADNYLPYCLGNVLKTYNYSALAFHNYYGTYFDRNVTHPNMGYECYFMGKGMSFTTHWPTSDLEMVEQAMDYIYEKEEPFVAYFMTFSGHYTYDFENNPMCARNFDKVDSLNHKEYPYAVRAYISCNLELEYALEYLMNSLEEAGELDNTVIVLTGDHYPYGLSESSYATMLGKDELDDHFEKYKNSFICYCSDMEEPIYCDNYCSNIDILPTILNLFGIEYDSRLLPGVDALSDSTHVAFLTDQSFINENIMFDSTTNTVSYLVDESELNLNYFENMVALVKRKFTLSTKILYTDYYRYLFDLQPFEEEPIEETTTTDSGINL